MIGVPAEADRNVIMNAFSWLLCAQRTLSSVEFLAAVSTTPQRKFDQLTKDHILDLCSNMVLYDATLDVFRFTHLSVREFLEKRPEYTEEATNAIAAKTCLLSVLSAADNTATQNFLSGYIEEPYSTFSLDLDRYSAFYWAPHCQLAATQRATGVLKDFLHHFLWNESGPKSAVTAWITRLTNELDRRDTDLRLYSKLKNI